MKFKKYMLKAVIPITIAFILIGFSSCKDDAPTVTKQEEVTTLLTASAWKMQNVTVDGADKTSLYKDLGLAFTSTSFTSTNGGVVWPPSGTWTFVDENATAIKRNDGLEVKLQEVTQTSLKLALTWNKTTLGAGRVQSVSGQHVFTFVK